MKTSTLCVALAGLVVLLTAIPLTLVQAHGEKIKIAAGNRGPVVLTAAQQQALDLKLVAAELRPLDTLLDLNGELALLPDKQADVTLRISGRIKALEARLGDRVRAGQQLALVESRAVGNPPPNVAVTAPMSGIIDRRAVILGQAVEPGTALFHISERSELRVVARVYEEDLGKVKVGQAARVRLLGYPDQVLTGKIILIDPNLDADSRTVAVWVLIRNPDDLLKPNMFAQVTVVLGRTEDALAIPSAAIIEADGQRFVFAKEGDQFHRVDVLVGATDDSYSEIADGLVPGDEVVTQGLREIYTLWLTGGTIKQEDD